MYIMKHLLLLLVVIITTGCERNIVGYSSNGIYDNGYTKIPHITYVIDDYNPGLLDASGIEGRITNIGDTTIVAPFWISVNFYSDSTFSFMCGSPDDKKINSSLSPNEVIEFKIIDYSCNCSSFPDFQISNFYIYKKNS